MIALQITLALQRQKIYRQKQVQRILSGRFPYKAVYKRPVPTSRNFDSVHYFILPEKNPPFRFPRHRPEKIHTTSFTVSLKKS